MSRSEIVDRHLPLKPVVFHILLALADQDLHGYGIMQDVRDRSGGHIRMETGPMYRHLRRLLDDGLIAEASERPEGADPRRGAYYELSALGRQVATAEAARLRALLAGSDALGLGTTGGES